MPSIMPHLGKMVLVSVEIFFRRMCLVYVKNNMAWRGMAIAWELFGIGEIIVCRIILHHKEQLIACDVEDAPTELMVPRDRVGADTLLGFCTPFLLG